MANKGIVTKVGKVNTGQGQYGQWWSKNVTFDNGDSGAIFEKNERALAMVDYGAECEYDLKSGPKGMNIKITNVTKQASSNGSGSSGEVVMQHNDTQKLIVRQTAFKGAIDLAVSIMPPDGATEKALSDAVERLTNRFYDLIMDNSHELIKNTEALQD
jgi:hypothetical protein